MVLSVHLPRSGIRRPDHPAPTLKILSIRPPRSLFSLTLGWEMYYSLKGYFLRLFTSCRSARLFRFFFFNCCVLVVILSKLFRLVLKISDTQNYPQNRSALLLFYQLPILTNSYHSCCFLIGTYL